MLLKKLRSKPKPLPLTSSLMAQSHTLKKTDLDALPTAPPEAHSQEKDSLGHNVSTLLSAVYRNAIAQIHNAQPIEMNVESLPEIAAASLSLQLIMHLKQLIWDELTSHALKVSERATASSLVATLETNNIQLIHQHAQAMDNDEMYMKASERPFNLLKKKAHSLISKIIYNEATTDASQLSPLGRSLLNHISEQLAEKGIIRRSAINQEGALILLSVKNGSLEEEAIIHMVELLLTIVSHQLDLSSAGLVFDPKVLLAANIEVSNANHTPYILQGIKLYEAKWKKVNITLALRMNPFVKSHSKR